MNIKDLRKEALENTKKLLKCGASVSFPYKSGMKDWYCQPSIGFLEEENTYVISGSPVYGYYKSEDAVEKFIDTIFSEKNYWVSLERLRKKLALSDSEWEYMVEYPDRKFLNQIAQEKKLVKDELNGT